MATQTQIITPLQQVRFDDTETGDWASFIHGSALVGPYLIGTPRRAPDNSTGSYGPLNIVRVDITDYSVSTVALPDPANPSYGLYSMDDTVILGGVVYTIAKSSANNRLYVIKITPDPLSAEILHPSDGNYYTTDGAEVVLSDGQSLWGFCKDHIMEWDLGAETWTLHYRQIGDNHTLGVSYPHSGVLDGDTIYLGMGSGNDHGVLKVDKTTLAVLDEVVIPKTTDDMDQWGDFLLLGIEEPIDGELGYGYGAVAVRKSDLQPFYLPALASSDNPFSLSYASLVFGNYLIDAKNNNYLYIIDMEAHPPDTWTLQSDVTQIVDYEIRVSHDFLYNVANEMWSDGDNIHVFMWPTRTTDAYSAAAELNLPVELPQEEEGTVVLSGGGTITILGAGLSPEVLELILRVQQTVPMQVYIAKESVNEVGIIKIKRVTL